MIILCEVYNNQIKLNYKIKERGLYMEEWKFVRDSKHYEISNMGNIRSLDAVIMRSDGKKYTYIGKILKPYKTKASYGDQYYYLIFLKFDINKHKLIHRLVMESFSPADNMDELDVNHKNGEKSDNRLENLEWCTKQENMRHARENGLWHPEARCGEKHPMSKLTEEDVIEIRRIIKNKEIKQCELAIRYNVKDSIISNIKKRKIWKHI